METLSSGRIALLFGVSNRAASTDNDIMAKHSLSHMTHLQQHRHHLGKDKGNFESESKNES
jgi:hypothetical protein